MLTVIDQTEPVFCWFSLLKSRNALRDCLLDWLKCSGGAGKLNQCIDWKSGSVEGASGVVAPPFPQLLASYITDVCVMRLPRRQRLKGLRRSRTKTRPTTLSFGGFEALMLKIVAAPPLTEHTFGQSAKRRTALAAYLFLELNSGR